MLLISVSNEDIFKSKLYWEVSCWEVLCEIKFLSKINNIFSELAKMVLSEIITGICKRHLLMNSLGQKSFFSSVECCKARNIAQGNFMTWNIADFKAS